MGGQLNLKNILSLLLGLRKNTCIVKRKHRGDFTGKLELDLDFYINQYLLEVVFFYSNFNFLSSFKPIAILSVCIKYVDSIPKNGYY